MHFTHQDTAGAVQEETAGRNRGSWCRGRKRLQVGAGGLGAEEGKTCLHASQLIVFSVHFWRVAGRSM